MSAKPYLLKETSWKSVQQTDYEIALLPWGATEAHNYHLPYGTDIIETEAVAQESARLAWLEGARIAVLPALPFGVNTGQMDIPLTINMHPSTQAAVLGDVAESLSGQGVPKLLILNGHGGNHFRQMIREIQHRFPGLFISLVDWFRILELDDYFDEPGDHAGEMETSLMMAVAPHQVRPLSDAGDGRTYDFKIPALKEQWAWAPRLWKHASRDTGIGDPSRATAEKGQRYFQDLTQKIAAYIIDLARADVHDLYEKE